MSFTFLLQILLHGKRKESRISLLLWKIIINESLIKSFSSI